MAASKPDMPRADSMPVLTPGGFVRLAWTEWGPPDAARVVVCAHGLTRTGRDFDPLATALAQAGWRVAAPDFPGRGRSDRLRRPEDYGYPVYNAVAAALIGRLGAAQVDWVGTSMGGIVGMGLAAQPGTPLRRMVVNDVGPFIPKASLERIARYVAPEAQFADLAAAEMYLRKVHVNFGALTDAQWRHLAVHSTAPNDQGTLRLHYDPAIAAAFAAGPIEDVAFWPAWDVIDVPMLVLRGANSDLLLAETAQEMTKRGAAAAKGAVTLREIPGCGHAPALMSDEQIALVRDFLSGP